MLFSYTTRGYTVNVIMEFLGLLSLPTTSSNIEESSESDEYKSAYPSEKEAVAVWFGIWGI